MNKSRQQALNANRDNWRSAKRDITYRPPKDLPGRLKAEKKLSRWLKRYLPEAFCLEWSKFHKISLRKLQSAIESGGSFAIALPRGSGKTTICKGAVLWALLTGQKRFVVVICATGKKGEALIKDLKNILRFNERLAEDYPEVCMPIRDLEGLSIKAHTQTAYGTPTMCNLGAGQLTLPTTKQVKADGTFVDNPASGSIVQGCGITGDIRGAQITQPDGEVLRPDFCLCDDPQTRESAKSVEQTKFRLDVILSDIAASEGTASPISVVVPCTIIRKGDLADQLLDNELHPDFRGECHPLLSALPKNMELWDQYNEARIKGMEQEDEGKGANAFYKAHRAELDDGIVATWEARKVGRVSAIQYAMDKYYSLGPESFAAEYQNKPENQKTLIELDPTMVLDRVNGLKMNQAPENTAIISGFADINRAGIHWCLTAFVDPLTGFVLNYGKWPERGELWAKSANEIEIRKAIHDGLTNLLAYIMAIPLMKGNQPAKLSHFMVDAGFSSDTVYNFVRLARLPFPIYSSRGVAHHRYFSGHKTTVANTAKDGCHLAESNNNRFIVHNSCRWREFTQRGFLSNVGAPGSCSLYGDQKHIHKLFAEHICAEQLTDIAVGDKGKVYIWATSPAPHDYLDALVGTFAGAGWSGFTMSGRKEIKIEIKRPLHRGRK